MDKTWCFTAENVLKILLHFQSVVNTPGLKSDCKVTLGLEYSE